VLSRGPAHEARLREINVPTSVMCGEQDALFPREEHERLAAAIPNATLKVHTPRPATMCTGSAPSRSSGMWRRS
jgi:pimeloyl-ACP methyl ester carboxylesterase